MTFRKPFVFFDLGETIINITDTIAVLSAFIRDGCPELVPAAVDVAGLWFIELARSVPRDESMPFKTQYQVGTEVLHRLLLTRGVEIDERSAGRILRRAWDEWQSRARLCDGVTKEWLHGVRELSAGVGAVTDGDEGDVHRLLEQTGLLSYFDSVTTSEAVQAYKPSSVIYHAALDSLRAPPNRSVFVSDSVLDLVGASAVGLAVVWLRSESSSESSTVPPGTLQLRQPVELNPVLSQFARTRRFEVP